MEICHRRFDDLCGCSRLINASHDLSRQWNSSLEISTEVQIQDIRHVLKRLELSQKFEFARAFGTHRSKRRPTLLVQENGIRCFPLVNCVFPVLMNR